MRLSSERMLAGRVRNIGQSVLIVGLMVVLMGVVGMSLFGKTGLYYGAFFGLVFLLFGRRVSPALILRMYRARLLTPETGGCRMASDPSGGIPPGTGSVSGTEVTPPAAPRPVPAAAGGCGRSA